MHILTGALNGINEHGEYKVDKQTFRITGDWAQAWDKLVYMGYLSKDWKITQLGADFLELYLKQGFPEISKDERVLPTRGECSLHPEKLRFTTTSAIIRDQKRADPKSDKKKQRRYKCPWCHGWHYTSSQEWKGDKL